MRQENAQKVWIQTFGCQMNDNDTDKMYRVLSSINYEPTSGPDDADLILLNTCAIREKAEQKMFSSLGRLKRFKERRPSVLLGVAGCVAQLLSDKITARAPYVDLVFGTYNIGNLPTILERARTDERPPVWTAPLHREDFDFLPMHEGDLLAPGPEENSRPVSMHVTIQNGCNKNCSYCVVPATRGREVSRPAADIVCEVDLLVRHGVREVTLVGQTVNSYGRGGPVDFADLLRMVDAVDGLERQRFVTSHPRDLREPLMAAMAECASVCEHLHLPVQSGSDSILKAMYRGYTTERYLSRLHQLRCHLPEISLSTDIIVGFPGEREEDFQATLDLLKEARFDSMYAFVYSQRPNTPAALRSDQVDPHVAADRLQRLLDLQATITRNSLEQEVGRTVEVLVEGAVEDKRERGHTLWRGRTRTNKLVHFPLPQHRQRQAHEQLRGRLLDITVTHALHHTLRGEL